jgi:hypothetical protein
MLTARQKKPLAVPNKKDLRAVTSQVPSRLLELSRYCGEQLRIQQRLELVVVGPEIQ